MLAHATTRLIQLKRTLSKQQQQEQRQEKEQQLQHGNGQNELHTNDEEQEESKNSDTKPASLSSSNETFKSIFINFDHHESHIQRLSSKIPTSASHSLNLINSMKDFATSSQDLDLSCRKLLDTVSGVVLRSVLTELAEYVPVECLIEHLSKQDVKTPLPLRGWLESRLRVCRLEEMISENDARFMRSTMERGLKEHSLKAASALPSHDFENDNDCLICSRSILQQQQPQKPSLQEFCSRNNSPSQQQRVSSPSFGNFNDISGTNNRNISKCGVMVFGCGHRMHERCLITLLKKLKRKHKQCPECKFSQEEDWRGELNARILNKLRNPKTVKSGIQKSTEENVTRLADIMKGVHQNQHTTDLSIPQATDINTFLKNFETKPRLRKQASRWPKTQSTPSTANCITGRLRVFLSSFDDDDSVSSLSSMNTSSSDDDDESSDDNCYESD
eukprot:TRINITY_DN3561_c0_g1_i2.p1 TRINITY_DN3561_c0_g1~~TRINITY_DN3561_c0_g1_i2.p1  ORF type:complete len:495 (+),score=146.15 TRINITY_DN3561_c0_g1_i2:148-1485(+)